MAKGLFVVHLTNAVDGEYKSVLHVQAPGPTFSHSEKTRLLLFSPVSLVITSCIRGVRIVLSRLL